MIVYDAQRRRVELGAEVGRGGEATVYEIVRQPDRLAKIYEHELRPNYAGKLSWMVEHPPENPTSKLAHESLAWPGGLLFDSRRKVVGYSMPYIRSAVPLLEVFNPRRRAEVLPKFDRRYLLRTAHNLAAALAALHHSGYVAGDLNESNVLVTPAALVTLIDTDSFQVREERGGKQIIHPCPVGKPEYTPPELQGKSLADVIRQPDHDAFGLAVLIFQLLMEGSHPFRAQWLGAGDPPPLEVRIANGAYPHVPSPAYPVRPPKNAPGIETLHPWISELMRRTFVDGHLDPRWRPGPELWARALNEAEQSMVCCAEGHFYFSHLPDCPYCVRQKAGSSPSRPAAPAGQAGSSRQAQPQPPFQQRRPGPARAGSRVRPAPGAAQAQGSSAQTPGPNVFRPANPFTARFRFAGAGAAAAVPQRGGAASIFGSPAVRGVLRGRPFIPPGAIRNWVRQRATKSFVVGGGQGAIAGALPGALIALLNWYSGEMLAWSLLVAIGGAAGGLLRGWKPGHKLAALIGRYVGWKLFWEAVGLVVGMLLGGTLGLVFIWAIFPVIIGLILGAQTGRYLGGKIYQFGSFLGWERLWGVFSALGFAAIGLGAAQLLGLAGMSALGANLANGLMPFASNGSFFWAMTWIVAGAGGGALSGALAGTISDMIGRLSGLVD